MFNLLVSALYMASRQQDVSFQYTLCVLGQNYCLLYLFIAAIAIFFYS